MSKGFHPLARLAEVAGPGLMLGVLTQLAAIGMILIMLGRSQRKSSSGTPASGGEAEGWHYDLMFIIMSLVILTTNGGRFVLFK